MPQRRLRRPDMKRVVIVVPSTFTLGNMFFGFWAVVSAYKGNYVWAAWFVVFAGILDMLDGRLARLSGAGTKFGAELDSLVDCVSFGVAPALIMYFLEFQTAGKFGWVLCWLYVVAVAVRLARYNVQHGTGKPGWFTGVPSPAAGMTLATYYPFSQTDWYRRSLAYLDFQREGLTILLVLLALLMVSTVKYPRLPGISVRTLKGWLSILLHVAILVGCLWVPEYFLFPFGLSYLAFGIVRQAVLALHERHDNDWHPQLMEGAQEGEGELEHPRMPAGGGGRVEG